MIIWKNAEDIVDKQPNNINKTKSAREKAWENEREKAWKNGWNNVLAKSRSYKNRRKSQEKRKEI